MSIQSGINTVQFKSQGCQLSGLLFTPNDFDANKKYPTVVFAGPLNQIKEQMGSFYGRKMVQKGFVYLTFDHFGYGDSEGMPRNAELVAPKTEGIRDAISYLRTLPFVDRDKLYGIGGCAGSQHMTIVAASDTRLKAYATVSGMMSHGYNYFVEMVGKDTFFQMLEGANEARQREYETGKSEYFDIFGYDNLPEEHKVGNEGYDYYMTERAGAQTYPNFTNHTLTRVIEDVVTVNSSVHAPYLFNPYLGIVGAKALPGEAPFPFDTGRHTTHFYENVNAQKELYIIEGASHVDLYDQEAYVDQAVDKIVEFFDNYGQQKS
ncbi:alpha/beta hydrolase [Candidatus Albibeggiatoa sp. nov. NOAA]|uniref:alpha/beta hydrolase n=1 Tax=Candidatus Albibeggiatoa sp. nov. NOAA TaxID=3162724 RepID=UPI0032F2BDE3|nr:alpha/beta hydrolase [Thiotrichaceae bacterium]